MWQAHNKYLIWIQDTHISTMPPKKKPRCDISGLKNQPKVTTDSSQINEPMSCASNNAVLPDPWINNDAKHQGKKNHYKCLSQAPGEGVGLHSRIVEPSRRW